LKVAVAKVPVPVAYGPAFEGERIRGEDIYLECGGGRSTAVEWTTTRDMNEVEDGKVEVIGPDIKDVTPRASSLWPSWPKWPAARCRKTSSLS